MAFPDAAFALLSPALIYSSVATVFSVFGAVNGAVNFALFRRPDDSFAAPAAKPAQVSVLIPARDEAGVIAACVESLLSQTQSGVATVCEVLVLDDRSSDDTGAIVASIAAKDSRVRLFSGGEPLTGWKGKPNALRQLIDNATGEYVLLTDADCVFAEDGVARSVAHAQKTGADCLSLMPELVAVSAWERIVLPLQRFLVFATLPVGKIAGSRNPAFAAANGAFLLLKTETYRELGGHEPVKAEMAEDIKFAQWVKQSGKRLVYGDGARVYRVRMYDSFRGIWDGFSKNLFPAMGKSTLVLLVWTAFLLLTQILPFVLLARALFVGDRTLALFWLPLAHAALALSLRLCLTLRYREPSWALLTHPVGWCIVVAIAWNSAFRTWTGRGLTWKGRTYSG